MDRAVPTIIICGILEAGKTHFLNEAIAEQTFIDAEAKGLIIQCEEGEEEINSAIMSASNTSYITVEEDEFSEEWLKEKILAYDPDVLYIEHNAMWENFTLPPWINVAQTISVVDASTFRIYLNNMRQKFQSIISRSDLVIMYHCDDEKESTYAKRNLQMLNRNLNFLLFDSNGQSVTLESDLPYSLAASVIEPKPEDFPILLFDMQESPDRYNNKRLKLFGKIVSNPTLPKGYFLISRRCMTCCVEDIQDFYMICDNKKNKCSYTDGMWANISGVMTYRVDPDGYPVPFIEIQSVIPAEKPVEEIIGAGAINQ